MPTRNHARFLRAAIDSVLSQSVPDLELIVYDDASSDETQAVLASVHDPRLRTFRRERPVGISANRNGCLAEARGRYIAWLDSDDLYLPAMLERQVSVLEGHPRVGLAHGNHDVIDESGRALPDWKPPFERDTVEPGGIALAELVLSNYVTAPTVLVRRECYDRLGRYDEDLSRSGEDWEMWMRIARRFDLAYKATRIAQYRVHSASSSASTVGSGERLRLDLLAVAKALASTPDRASLGARARAALAVKGLIRSGDLFALGRRREAVAAAVLALRLAGPGAAVGHGPLLLLALVRGDEYGSYRHGKAVLGRLHRRLDGTRFGESIRKLAVLEPAWQRTLAEVARTVRREVPRRSRVAVVDKEDPTILHLSGRKGWHFPDRRYLPGLPPDSEAAIVHLEQLRTMGAEYLVVPCSAFWWLDFYQGFREHVERRYRLRWRDERCAIYEVTAERAPVRRRAVMEVAR
jgi:hypothetical protein